ncbi:unnamed protein product [Lactuca saligna]|uniref:Uncharacterized protein n=1 Tax=Lactuca saligna TaxID=75948 RepID=A0AA35Z6T2_LACSI|nr:unnamed protein product [Lactuca saligna]
MSHRFCRPISVSHHTLPRLMQTAFDLRLNRMINTFSQSIRADGSKVASLVSPLSTLEIGASPIKPGMVAMVIFDPILMIHSYLSLRLKLIGNEISDKHTQTKRAMRREKQRSRVVNEPNEHEQAAKYVLFLLMRLNYSKGSMLLFKP